MISQNDLVLTKITIRIADPDSDNTIGTGFLYTHNNLVDHIYAITAAHNLFKDSDGFTQIRETVSLHIYSPTLGSYTPLSYIKGWEERWVKTPGVSKIGPYGNPVQKAIELVGAYSD